MEHAPLPAPSALNASPGQAYRQARVVVGALMTGVVLFYAVILGYVAFFGVEPTAPGISPALALTIWAVVAVGTFPMALLFRNRAAALSDELRRSDRAPEPTELGNVNSNAIVAAALLEGPALLAGAMTFMTGDTRLLVYGGLVFLIGMVVAFPRAEWYGVDERRG